MAIGTKDLAPSELDAFDDERLVAEGRLRPLASVSDIALDRKPAGVGERVRRDPAQLVDLALSGLRR